MSTKEEETTENEEVLETETVLKKLGITIPIARCRTHIAAALKDFDEQEEYKTLKKAKKETGTVDGDARIKEIDEKTIRIANETPVAAAIVWDGAMKELIRHGIRQTLANQRKTVKISFLQEGDVDELLYYSCYSNLADWLECDENIDSASLEKDKNSFFTYLDRLFNEVKCEAEFLEEKMRKTENLLLYLSKLLIAGLKVQATIAGDLMHDIARAKTVNVVQFKATVKAGMHYGNKSMNDINGVMDAVNNKLVIFSDDKKEKEIEKEEKRIASLSPEELKLEKDEKEAAEIQKKNESNNLKEARVRKLASEIKESRAMISDPPANVSPAAAAVPPKRGKR
jgi:hypothetical protein